LRYLPCPPLAAQAVERLKDRVRAMTWRSAGRSLAQICEPLGKYLAGRKAYFRLAETPGTFADIDKWVRHRLRGVQHQHWKRGRTIYSDFFDEMAAALQTSTNSALR
jgi:RNA-directed DNA polymerase